MYEGDIESGASGGAGGGRFALSKLLISNLDYGVSNADIKVGWFVLNVTLLRTCVL